MPRLYASCLSNLHDYKYYTFTNNACTLYSVHVKYFYVKLRRWRNRGPLHMQIWHAVTFWGSCVSYHSCRSKTQYSYALWVMTFAATQTLHETWTPRANSTSGPHSKHSEFQWRKDNKTKCVALTYTRNKNKLRLTRGVSYKRTAENGRNVSFQICTDTVDACTRKCKARIAQV